MSGLESPNGVGEVTAVPDSASSLAKMLYILQLFSETEPVWSTAAILEALETSRSTGYRYIKTLHDAGLLNTVRNGHYTLGPRIIEMDLQIRQTDPLLLASHGVLEDLVDKIGHSALLCTAYGDSVLCVAECRDPMSPANRFSRGERRPLFQGAISKVILAHLPHYRLKAIYPRQREEIEKAGLGSTWSDFRATLGKFKKDGYVMTVGEFNPGVCGVAAPILTDQKTALGSVGVAWDVKERSDVDVQDAVLAVKQAATTISERMMEKQLR
ncbi:IclR family transcriptional regulator [Rhodococcus sp. T2V]|uniref:IclR family transcriptional regulator n=1 Tax=Rhodococcus sp. T2V TaxID=3034164 RepID=UPI0023E2656D|nr:IclR family transcriptional regulator [Rhodococcus sp. T2V]MDF3311216.1 IclR family transcriptional regulator [Rhodococcus sp. T2V]